MKVLVVFYSFPEESSLTGIFRGIEVCCPNKVLIMASRRRCGDVESLIGKLKNFFESKGIDFDYFCNIPDVETSLDEIPLVIDYLRSITKNLKGDVCLMTSCGSRLELSSILMLVKRDTTELLYVSFLWGPWSASFYPYTPKPIQIVHEVHPTGKVLCLGPYPYIDNHEVILPPNLTKLRKEVLNAQYLINSSLSDTPCIATRDGIDCKCPKLMIRIYTGNVLVSNTVIRDYCDYDSLIQGIKQLCNDLDRLRGKIPDVQFKALKLLLSFSGIYLPVVEDLNFNIGLDLKGYLLLDAIRYLRRSVIIDTNVAYFSLHTQIYEDPATLGRYLTIPLCLYLELYRHQAQITNPYEGLRAYLSHLATEEINHWGLNTEVSAFYTPCEVGLAITSRANRYIVVTGDRSAYDRLMRFLDLNSLLIKPTPLSDVRFLSNEKSRRVSYAYYAIAQLKALTKLKHVKESLRRLNINVEITLER